MLRCPIVVAQHHDAYYFVALQVMPGDNVEMVGELVHDVALEEGSRFTLREGGKTSEFFTSSRGRFRDTDNVDILLFPSSRSWYWYRHQAFRIIASQLFPRSVPAASCNKIDKHLSAF